MEDPSGGFVFTEVETARSAGQLLGVSIDAAAWANNRQLTLKKHKDGRLIAEIDHQNNDQPKDMAGWLLKKNKWMKIFSGKVTQINETENENFDDLVRHLVTGTAEDFGWMVKSEGTWRSEPLSHIRVVLGAMGMNNKEVTNILGTSVLKPWKIVNKPFEPEYPGNREWNRNSAQFAYSPEKGDNHNYDTWRKILKHCGEGLDDCVKEDSFCKANGILTGEEYLMCWIASVFQEPRQPLPYLFFHGPQDSGKSIFHESIKLLLTKGYKRADAALISGSGFNGELEGSIVCVIEETDLRINKSAYNRIKDWVTSSDLMIHPKGKTPYHVPNTSHWVQCANDHNACPIFKGDTRITVCYVPSLDPLELIPKKQLLPMLEKEAPAFLAALLDIELPISNSRLNIPVVTSSEKAVAEQLNRDSLQVFIDEKCENVLGHQIKFSEFFDRFQESLDPNEIGNWGKIRVGKNLPPHFPKGRMRSTGQFYIGNIAWRGVLPDEKPKPRLVLRDNYLEAVTSD
jgi:hypothetical protein